MKLLNLKKKEEIRRNRINVNNEHKILITLIANNENDFNS